MLACAVAYAKARGSPVAVLATAAGLGRAGFGWLASVSVCLRSTDPLYTISNFPCVSKGFSGDPSRTGTPAGIKNVAWLTL